MQELFPDSIWLEADKNGRFLWAHAVGVSPVVTSTGPVGRSERFPMIYRGRTGLDWQPGGGFDLYI